MEIDEKTRQENAERIAEEYLSSLQDLTWNSKPLINVLTILAEENIEYASVIVNVVQKHIAKVGPEIKLPLLYLIDSILKNVKNKYVTLFSQCIIGIFCGVFEVVNEKIRERMYALRQTWNAVFTQSKLYALDVKVKLLDANWPITAPPPQPSIHVNPNFLKPNVPVEEILQTKTRELLELKKRKLELELQATIKNLEEQQKKDGMPNENSAPSGTSSPTPGTSTSTASGTASGPGSGAGQNQSFASNDNSKKIPPLSGGAVSGHPTNRIGNRGKSSLASHGEGGHMSMAGNQRAAPGNVFNPNFRQNRPQNFPSSNQPNQMQQLPQGSFSMPMLSNHGKTKVSPVSPAMISSLRTRDPRIVKRQQKQNVDKNSQQNHPSHPVQSSDNNNSTINRLDEKNSSDSRLYRGTSRSRNENDRNKAVAGSPSRNSSNRSSGRSSNKNSNANSNRDKDHRDNRNKRSDSSKNSSSERQRKGSEAAASTAIPSAASSTYKNDKKTNDIGVSSAYKRKSASPNHSPHKSSSKESISSSSSKRSSKSRNANSSSRNGNNTGKHSSRSPSPSSKSQKDGNSSGGGGSGGTAIRRSSPSATLEKRLKLSSNGTSDLEKEDLSKTASNLAALPVTKDLDKHSKRKLECSMAALFDSPNEDTDLRQLIAPHPPRPFGNHADDTKASSKSKSKSQTKSNSSNTTTKSESTKSLSNQLNQMMESLIKKDNNKESSSITKSKTSQNSNKNDRVSATPCNSSSSNSINKTTTSSPTSSTKITSTTTTITTTTSTSTSSNKLTNTRATISKNCSNSTSSKLVTSGTSPTDISTNSTSVITATTTTPPCNDSNDLTTTTTTTTSNCTSPTTCLKKVSFRIKKIFNKFEKSTENLSTESPTPSVSSELSIQATPPSPSVTSISGLKPSPSDSSISSSISSQTTSSDKLNSSLNSVASSNALSARSVSNNGKDIIDEQPVMKGNGGTIDVNDDDLKKRIPATVTEDSDSDAPLAKKSKTSSQLEMLFGEEDVDFRSVAPPPPIISTDKKPESWDNFKSSNKSGLMRKGHSFEDVRAKLAKATKNNKSDKSEKANKNNLANNGLDLALNEDSLEANEEKVRTIISQAQEMLETNSIDKEQYKHLVQTVMCINETNKLKEAQRRESLNVQKPATPTITNNHNENPKGQDRLAAKEAIFKKRIPKIPKKINDDQKGNGSPFNEASNSPSYDDKAEEENPKPLNKQRDRRNKSTKWSDRFEPSAPSVNLSMNPLGNFGPTTRPWMNNTGNNMQNKRGNVMGPGPGPGLAGNFRPNLSTQGIPPLINPTILRMPQLNWQMGNNAGGFPSNNMGQNMGMNNMGPNMGPNNIGHNNMGPNNMGHNNMGPNNMGSFMPSMGGSLVPPPPQPPSLLNIPTNLGGPPQIPKPCNSIDNPQAEMVRTITIDGAAKEIRVYDKVAIVFMDIDEPREIGFQNGQRSIFIDNQDAITLRFNDDFKPYQIDGKIHHLRFGFPSRELYIDEHWYEIYFGGSPVSIPLGNRHHIIKAEGPPPQVNIGPVRKDLVVGKINMIVDAHTVVPLFLDARIQKYRLNNGNHSVQFADRLLTILLDGEPYQVEYGGLPKSYNLGGKKYFIRFGALPKGVVPGKVYIMDMLNVKLSPTVSPMEIDDDEEIPPPPPITQPIESDILPSIPSSTNDNQLPALNSLSDTPATGSGSTGPTSNTTTASTTTSGSSLPTAALKNLNIDELFQKLVSSGILNSALPVAPVVTGTTSSLKTDNAETSNDAFQQKTETNSNSSNANPLDKTIDPPAQKVLEPIVNIELKKPETIRVRQAAIVATLYSGMQCSSCGVRFPPEQTMKYSQHLDWHFRQNRRERDATRKAHYRKWYYDLSDWVQYEEIEDLDEREKNFFEAQQNEIDAVDETSNQRSLNSPIPSCPAGPDDVDRQCDMCQEKFEQYYNEDLEEWHLKSAIRVENHIYHPLCYEDHKASLNPPKESDEMEVDKEKNDSLITDDDNAVDIVIKHNDDDDKLETDAIKVADDDEDDDDDVIVLPNEEPSVTEIVDDDEDEYVPVNITSEEMGIVHEEDPDLKENETKEKEKGKEKANDTLEDDVQIQEPNIPFTDLDTYVEKDLLKMDSNSEISFLNVKIKEEPKDDSEDEDDGFEDVGTVLIEPGDEISLHSSEGTQTQTISSATSPLPAGERPDSVLSQPLDDIDLQNENAASEVSAAHTETTTTTVTTNSAGETNVTDETGTTTSNAAIETIPNLDLNVSMDGDFETSYSEHNLSAAGPAPAIPIASLVNKIKINISKNTSSSGTTSHNTTNNPNNIKNNSDSNSTNPKPNPTNANAHIMASPIASLATNSSMTIGATSSLSNNMVLNSASSSSSSCSSNTASNSSYKISEYSTIPVLCSGSSSNRFVSQAPPPIMQNMMPPITSMANSMNHGISNIPRPLTTVTSNSLNAHSNISAISVIGSSYGGSAMNSGLNTLSRMQPNLTISTPAASSTSTTTVPIRKAATPPPPIPAVVEETITYEVKPALKEANLKKMKKIEQGIETSGLCSIM